MPSSSVGLIPIVVRMVQALKPCSVLDIGFGMGKYGLLCREYLELWGPEKWQRFGKWRTRIDGIEACEACVGDVQRAIYNQVYIGDAVDVLRGLTTRSMIWACWWRLSSIWTSSAGRSF